MAAVGGRVDHFAMSERGLHRIEDDLADSKQFFDKFGSRLPRELREEHEKLSGRLSTKGASLARSG